MLSNMSILWDSEILRQRNENRSDGFLLLALSKCITFHSANQTAWNVHKDEVLELLFYYQTVQILLLACSPKTQSLASLFLTVNSPFFCSNIHYVFRLIHALRWPETPGKHFAISAKGRNCHDFLCCSSFLFVHRWLHMWRLFCHFLPHLSLFGASGRLHVLRDCGISRESSLIFFLFVCCRSNPVWKITKTRLFKYIENFITKNWKFSDKNSDIFHISAQNIACGYSLEPLRRDGSNEYPQSMFLSRDKKNNSIPLGTPVLL